MMRHGLATLAATMAITIAGAEAAPPNLRIGLALPHDGPYQALAQSVERGWYTAIAEAGGKVGGRKIEIVSIDTKGDPATAHAVAVELLRPGRIDILAGVINSGVAVMLGRLANRFKRPLVGGPWLYGEANWPAMGSAASGARQVVSHLRSLGNRANRRFIAAYRARYHADPDLYAYFGYENARPVLAAVAALKGDTADGAKVIATLTKRSYAMPRGELRFNADNNAAIDNLYLARLERTSGKPWRRYVETIAGAGDPPDEALVRPRFRSPRR